MNIKCTDGNAVPPVVRKITVTLDTSMHPTMDDLVERMKKKDCLVIVSGEVFVARDYAPVFESLLYSMLFDGPGSLPVAFHGIEYDTESHELTARYTSYRDSIGGVPLDKLHELEVLDVLERPEVQTEG